MTVPKKAFQTDSALVRALQEDSETLQNITDQFAPLMDRFRIFFLWEQERTDLRYTREYIVEESSAAPLMSGDTERSGVAADHQGMCKFGSRQDQAFRTVVAALKRYATDAEGVVRERHVKAEEAMKARGWQEATELVKALPRGVHRAHEVPAETSEHGQHTILEGETVRPLALEHVGEGSYEEDPRPRFLNRLWKMRSSSGR